MIAPAAGLAAILAFATPQQAHATECLLDTNDNGIADGADTDGGATGTGADSLACGVNTDASAEGSVAVGGDPDNNGVGTTASGTSATALGGDALASGFGSTAVGGDADFEENPGDSGAIASGDLSSAFGADAVASGDGSTAVGAFAEASGDGAMAMGVAATAAGDGSLAVGLGALAAGTGSTALGAGAVATLPGEFVMGTSDNTYTAPGITSTLSRARQVGPLGVVTSDAFGHLSWDGGALFDQVGELKAGVALAMALESPELATTENFAIRAGYGNFEGGSHAFGVSMIGNFADNEYRWSWDAGFGAGWSDFFGYDSGATWGGRAGVQMAW